MPRPIRRDKSTINPGRQSARRGDDLFLLDLPLEHQCPWGKFAVSCFGQEGVEAAPMVDGLQCIGRDPQPHRAAERIGNQRDFHQIGHEPAFRLAVRMAYLVPDLGSFAGQLASPSHGVYLSKALLNRAPFKSGPLKSEPRAPGARQRAVVLQKSG